MKIGFSKTIPEWAIQNKFESIALPTEIVIEEPKVVVPRYGRVYETNYYYRCQEGQDLYLNYVELSKLQDFRGTSYEDPVMVYEYFTDIGDDGHTDYGLVGYITYTKNEFYKMQCRIDFNYEYGGPTNYSDIGRHWAALQEIIYKEQQDRKQQ